MRSRYENQTNLFMANCCCISETGKLFVSGGCSKERILITKETNNLFYSAKMIKSVQFV